MAATGEPRTDQRVGAEGETRPRPVPPEAWHGLSVFVLPESAAMELGEAVAGIARGMEILEILPLDVCRRPAVVDLLGPQRRFAAAAGEPQKLVVACDVPPAPGESVARINDRIAAVARYTTRRLLKSSSPPYEAVRYTIGPREAMALLEMVEDPTLETRLQAKVGKLAEACAMPFPVIQMLGADSPGFRARVALVDHPVHGRSVCKIFRPGAMTFFERELHARTVLADQPLAPRLLEHGPNWLLTPEYFDDGAHRLRALSGVQGVHQLRPWAARAAAEFARAMHERGMFMLDLSPQNLMSDPVAGLKVIDLEFALRYAEFPGTPPSSASAAWSFRGVPAESAAGAELPKLVFTKGVGNAVFHPAVAGLPAGRLLAPPRRRDGLRRVTTQMTWFVAMVAVGRVHAVLRRGW